SGDLDGVVRVGPITGGAPHLLFGHQNQIGDVTVDPTGKWIASTQMDKPIVRLWPMPQGTPLQALSHEDLIKRLSNLTNTRVIADKTAAAGYRIEITAFPGWAELPHN